MGTRIEYLKTNLIEEKAPNHLPDEIVESIQNIVDQLA